MKKHLKLPTIRTPQFLGDLFRDLRDRRLLPILAVVVVATLAVPFVLSGSQPSADPAPGQGVAAGADPDSSSQLAVVADDPGLRDYRGRLDGDPKDPFEQRFTAPAGLGAAQLGDGPTGPSTTIGGEQGGGAGEEPPGGGPPSTGEGGEGSEPPTTSEPEQPEPAYVVTVRLSMGEKTNTRKLTETTVLPGTENPLLVFRGLNDKGNKAVFRVGESVSAIFGDAKCLEGTDRCELIEVEPGFPVSFVYGEPERLYRLTVVDIEHNR